ncbi:MaoC family dehydratase [Nocardioides eburneiflavus]|uniref:MaoC family dehydratase n=1 Tax=Nocardioides eburneiflavus TaxID=2518372 RepID=A0A4Z1CKV2_9ACTN|nr:MaoC family dehydratase [Nocardioides eburneiflavus]TGN65070.1 MaoC family dehydratase [Nocardioides eburneiflavus]
MKVFRSVEELRDAVGTHVGHSDWYDIDQRRVDLFAEATGDFQWIHVDRERAAAGPFGSTIAHGFLTLSLLPVLTWGVYRTEGFRMEINYGLNKVRFPAPVTVASRVRAGVEMISLEEFGNGYMSTTRIVIEREGADKPVCVAESLGYMVPA